MQLSTIRTQLLYRRGARLFWKSSYGPMIPGLQNGYAISVFQSEHALRDAVQHYSYSELFAKHEWKVGTATTTDTRLRRMFEMRRPLLSPEDIWSRFYIPLIERLSKYQSDTKNLAAGSCVFMKDTAIKNFIKHDQISFLMIPLALGFQGSDTDLENEMSQMIVNAGGMVINDKKKQSEKIRAAPTRANINLADTVIPDKLLELTPRLQQIGFELHPDYSSLRST